MSDGRSRPPRGPCRSWSFPRGPGVWVVLGNGVGFGTFGENENILQNALGMVGRAIWENRPEFRKTLKTWVVPENRKMVGNCVNPENPGGRSKTIDRAFWQNRRKIGKCAVC